LRPEELRNHGEKRQVLDAPRLIFAYTPLDQQKSENNAAKFAEAAVRIPGGLLLLYKDHVPGQELLRSSSHPGVLV
jgi:hypothetical protein